jgi:hypothetical protein
MIAQKIAAAHNKPSRENLAHRAQIRPAPAFHSRRIPFALL